VAGERDWYDDEYLEAPEPQDIAAEWASSYYPMNATVLESVGDVTGQDVLLLGNGTSQKELLFADTARRVVYSDYSPRAVRVMADAFPRDNVEYRAIDAMDLPFSDESMDVVYGYAFVHHLPDPARFLREAERVLRPGGRAVFMDNPRSPLYQKAKTGMLEPLMRYYHKRGGISPEDLRATETGWLSVDDLRAMLDPLGVRPFFHRSLLVHYLFSRAAERLPPQWLFRRDYHANRRAQFALVRLDDWLSRFRVVRENQMRLVWGFVK
jgi:ubiquinone/menaquinone biosynthesis C-methylase UbiE